MVPRFLIVPVWGRFFIWKDDELMQEYNHLQTEKKWQDYWYSKKLFKAVDFDKRKKFYGLIEFPYPSGSGMHVGHIRAFASLEIISRKRRMEGFNVLFPIGFDAFGLPTENYALKTGIHPRKVTDDNIAIFTQQLKMTGFSFDFERVVDTTDENYYKWTQWIFLELFRKGLAYKSNTYVNFCPSCKVVLANEDSQGGKCDRCDSDVVQKQKDVWFLKITDYSESLLQGLEKVNYLPRIKSEQENWIGKSIGAEINFALTISGRSLSVFTTRADTIYGATFMVIAPEHKIIDELKNSIKNFDELKEYLKQAQTKTEFERVQMAKNKTGVQIKGINAINPLTKKEIPIFVADYVMMGYGTGAIMAVPAHDERDYDFAKKFKIPMIEVIAGGDIAKEAFTEISSGKLVNSEILNGLSVKDAIDKMIAYLEANKFGTKMINYKMKDWAFNRQRYWGEPIPIINCPRCGQIAMSNKALPLKLPKIDKFEPGLDGESPLNSIPSFVNITCPKCGSVAKRETDTMPQWAGSSWYYLRYIDPNNQDEFASYDKLKYWLPVDWYNGGMEHVTRHMIYSRFWNHFLFDQGYVPVKEPYAKRTAQGLILGPDGEKMSKSKGNVVDPINIINQYGADTLRTYILFIGDYEQSTPWNENGLKGVKRFLDRTYRFVDKIGSRSGFRKELETIINKTIKDVSSDIEETKFNTAISKLMILSNEYAKYDDLSREELMVLIKLLNPFSPHITEEINELIGNKDSLVYAFWPQFDPSKVIDKEVEIAVQVNGKLRGTVFAPLDAAEKLVEQLALNLETVKSQTSGKTIRKIIVVKNKIVNIVV